jgi:ribosome maturation factor RimP
MNDLAKRATNLHGIDRSKLEQTVEPIARAHGAEVVDLELKSEHGAWVLRVLVEKLGAAENKLSTKDAAVDLDVCSGISRDLSPALDVADLVPHAYNLEVGSPGVERTLRGEADFVRFAGEKAKIKVTAPVAGQKVLVGVLGPVSGATLTVKDGGRDFQVPLADIESARLVFEFGKPGGPPKGKPGKKRH